VVTEPAADGLEVPAYGRGSLADLVPSVLASLGVPGEPDVLGLPPARRACVLLVDGMGWEPLTAHRHLAPFLGSLIDAAAPITAGFPTTTATSLTSVGTGLPPGAHGVLGARVADPDRDRAVDHLRWPADLDPERWQPRATAYQRARRAGVDAAYVASGAYEGTGLNRASARGGRYVAAEGADAVAAATVAALAGADRAFVFAYHSELDSLGHRHGVDSAAWRAQLGRVDRFAARIADTLPPGTALYVTADHGMVDTAPETRVDVEGAPDLAAGVRLLAGEARARQVYARPGAAADVLAAWRDRLTGRAAVLSRDEAIDRGLFGPVAPHLRARIGDVLALALGRTALVAPAADPAEAALIGHHGSLTPAELRVPLLRAGTAA
jgi:hypothetical protein